LGAVLSALLVALLAGYGTHLVATAIGSGWRGVGPGPRRAAPRAPRPTPAERARSWLSQAGLGEVDLAEFAAALGGLTVIGALVGGLVFGAFVPAVVIGALAGSLPVAAYRRRRNNRREHAREAWPRLIDEIRILTGSAGHSIPQALLEVGRSGPEELRPAFAAAQREWLLSTDFTRTVAVLKQLLADPTADVACETLLIAHELGGTELDRRLDDLATDRRIDVQERKDALARQAGARFARRFVLIVPAGMAVVGLSVGTGRDAYATPAGQAAVLVALALVATCWIWAGRVMRLPHEERIFP
jgi:tight adherence protein B